jgi:hypothetical protein
MTLTEENIFSVGHDFQHPKFHDAAIIFVSTSCSECHIDFLPGLVEELEDMLSSRIYRQFVRSGVKCPYTQEAALLVEIPDDS